MLRNTIVTAIATVASGSQFRTGLSGVDAPSSLSQRAKGRSHLQARVDRLLPVPSPGKSCSQP
jgi:hypothetical protein